MTTSTTDATETGGPPPGPSAEPAPVPGVAASAAPSHRAPRPIPTAVPDEQPEPATTDAGTPPPTQGTEATEAMSITETTGIPTGEDATQPVPVSAPTPSPEPDAAYSGDTLAIPVTPAADGEATVAIPVAAPPSGGPAAPARSYPVPTTPPASASATDTATAAGAVVAGAAAAASPTPQPQWTSPEDVARAQAVPAGEDGAFPEDALDEPTSRTAAHWWGVLIAFTLTPIAWFLLFDGSARIYWSMLADPANVNPAGYLSLGFGLATLAILLLAARKSSVGSIIVGSLAALAGLAFVAVPVQTLEFLSRYADRIESLGGFGRNLYAYTVESGMRSYFLIGGVILIFVGVVSHAARRQGRREERARLALRPAQGENPFV